VVLALAVGLPGAFYLGRWFEQRRTAEEPAAPPLGPQEDPGKGVNWRFGVPTPAISTTAYELWESFRNNDPEAMKYKGKYVLVTGVVCRRLQEAGSLRFPNRPYIGLEVAESRPLSEEELAALPPHQQRWFHEGYPPNVVCYINPASQTAFAQVLERQQIKVLGQVLGGREADAWQNYVLDLVDCRLSAPG
jgi:hypothetical protein